MKREAAKKLFDLMHPDFFHQPYIASLEKGRIFEEQTLFLEDFSADALKIPVP